MPLWRPIVASCLLGACPVSLVALTAVNGSVCWALAFPGAVGGGALATGGRGGRVIEVTNLNDDGPGSLRRAVSASGPRTVLFHVAGNISLKSPLVIQHGDLTLAGQSAPGDGISIANYAMVLSKAQNVIIRYLRLRPGDLFAGETDALSGMGCRNVIIDHCSASWSTDECISIYRSQNVTVGWCLISESLYDSTHSKGPHGYGGIWGGSNTSWHHNLLAHHTSRNPRFANDCSNVDFSNNVIYNWGFNSAYGGEDGSINIINNYYKSGPATKANCKERILDGSGKGGRWYIAGNVVAKEPRITPDNWLGVHRPYTTPDLMRRAQPFPNVLPKYDTAEQAYALVLNDAGATRPKRDTLDERIVAEVRSGKSRYGGRFGGDHSGIIDSQETVGGWPIIRSSAPPADSDHDGMSDLWERQQKLDPLDPTDGPQDTDGDGYTNLEEYLNGVLGKKTDYQESQ